LTVAPVAAGEVIPSLGLTRTIDGDDDVKMYGGVALRAPLASALKAEVSVMYRNEERLGGDVDIRMWPVTGSLWVSPVPVFYLGGGVGWYNTTIDYADEIPLDSETSQDFGVHLGGGLAVPITSSVGVDLGGRYVFMEEVETEFEDLGNLDPDFWTTSLGLSLTF
jgi:hypothetical protein